MEPWRTAIVNKDETHIWLRGYDITQLMSRASFASVLFLLHKNRLPTDGEERLFNALLIASADHGSGAPSCATARLAASGNRESLSAAVAAGILAIGDVHGGAGALTMDVIRVISEDAKTAGQDAHPTRDRACNRKSTIDIRNSNFGGIAQLVERQLCKLEVRGSNPLASSLRSRRRRERRLSRRSLGEGGRYGVWRNETRELRLGEPVVCFSKANLSEIANLKSTR